MGAAPTKRADVMLKKPNGCIALSEPISDRTERIPGRQDTETDQSEMRPIVSTFGKNIVVNRAQQDQKETNEMMVQTDTEIFFKYIFDFMGELERRISSGEITLEDILAMGRMSKGEELEEKGKAAGASAWNYASPDKRQAIFSVQELQECLRRLKGLGKHGGDQFFAGVARTMVAKPILP